MQKYQNHGPRTDNIKATVVSGTDQAKSFAADGSDYSSNSITIISRDEYNPVDFHIKFDYVLFSFIKSYSANNIYKCIKRNLVDIIQLVG